MTWAYYNEIEPYCAQWLRNLIEASHIPAGEVDERDIREVSGDDLKGFGQVHLFAGIGGFAFAARLAGLPDDYALLTGGPPCQPTSIAGAMRGESDDRYLWPEMARLIAEIGARRVVYENPTGTPRLSIDRVCADLESQGYEVCPPIILPACAVDAPHRRDRVWVVAYSQCAWATQQERSKQDQWGRSINSRESGSVEHAAGSRRNAARGASQEVSGPELEQRPTRRGGALDDTLCGRYGASQESLRSGWDGAEHSNGRRVKPGICLLAHGIPQRVAKLHAFGNAIVPEVAAKIMMAIP